MHFSHRRNAAPERCSPRHGRGQTHPATTNPHCLRSRQHCAPDGPAVIGEALAAGLLRAAALAHGVEQLDLRRVDGTEHGQGGQEGLGPGLKSRKSRVGPTALKLRYDLISLSPVLTLVPFSF